MRIPVFIVLFMAFSRAVFPMPAEKNAAASDKQTAFLRKLLAERRHFECIAETRRYLFYNSNLEENKKNGLTYFIAANYYLGNQYASAAKIAAEELPANYTPGRILLSQALKKSGLFGQSLHVFDGLEYPAGDPFLRYELLIRKADALIALGKYDEAAREIESQEKFFSSEKLRDFSRALAGHPRTPQFDACRTSLYSAIIPGAGQVLAGKYIDGVLSLAAVFLSGFGAWHYHRQGDASVRNFFAVFTGIFYLGNIYGGYNSASAANRSALKKYNDDIIHRFIPPYEPLRFTEIPEISP